MSDLTPEKLQLILKTYPELAKQVEDALGRSEAESLSDIFHSLLCTKNHDSGECDYYLADSKEKITFLKISRELIDLHGYDQVRAALSGYYSFILLPGARSILKLLKHMI